MSFVRLVDVGENFEEGGFPRSVSADNAEKFAFFDFKGNVVEGVEDFVGGMSRRDARFCVCVGIFGCGGDARFCILVSGWGGDARFCVSTGEDFFGAHGKGTTDGRNLFVGDTKGLGDVFDGDGDVLVHL